MTTCADQRYPLFRGTILRRVNPPESTEVGIVLGLDHDAPSVYGQRILCLHGWTDHVPDVIVFALSEHQLKVGDWVIANDVTAAKARELFLAHAEKWGEYSNAWIAADGEMGDALTPPIALREVDTTNDEHHETPQKMAQSLKTIDPHNVSFNIPEGAWIMLPSGENVTFQPGNMTLAEIAAHVGGTVTPDGAVLLPSPNSMGIVSSIVVSNYDRDRMVKRADK